MKPKMSRYPRNMCRNGAGKGLRRRHLKDSKIEIAYDDVVARGYTPRKVCKG